jgi:uroporphyrinogen III methyltransferase/synthase
MVYLVGAGPGVEGLLTLRAVECLRRAEVVLYDRLVPAAMLAFAPDAEQVCVTELAGTHSERCPHIHRTMIDAARRGKCVVRLKGGDPLIFGRGGEEAEALREAGIDFEIVPGVSAALGAAAYAGIPLTHRQHASAVAFVTAHESPDKEEGSLDWDALARFPGTLVFYMGLARLAVLSETLVARGKPADTPAALVQNATLPGQRVVTTTLAALPDAAKRAGLVSPTLTVVGSVVRLRESVAWLERRPLHGKCVLVTRPAGQERDLVRRLEELGAEVLFQPTVSIEDPPDFAPVDRALRGLADYQWLVFTSVNGVHRLLTRLRQTGRDLRALGGLKLAAIGPATADALRSYHLEPDIVPSSFRSEDLAASLLHLVTNSRVLLARADRGRDTLRELLSTVAIVEQVAVYSQRDVVEADPAVLGRLRRGEIDWVTVTSSNIARSLARLLDAMAAQSFRSGKPGVITISPVTSTAVRELGWPVAAEARTFTSEGVVEAVLNLVAGRGGGQDGREPEQSAQGALDA